MLEFNDMAQAIAGNQPSRYLIVILAILLYFSAHCLKLSDLPVLE
jgi:hypothetical protein